METIKEYEKVYKTKNIKLSKFLKEKNFKIRELDTENINYECMDYPFLKEDLYYFIEEKLKEKKIYIDNMKLYFSLSYCQGDGVEILGTFNHKHYKDYKIKSVNNSCRYHHYNSFDIYAEDENGEEAKEEINKKISEIFKEISREAEKFGYEWIEAEDKDTIIKNNIISFLDEYNINTIGLETDYITTEKNGFIKIFNGIKHLNIEAVYIPDINLKIDYKTKTKITEYKTINEV